MAPSGYLKQVELLVEALPVVARADGFALEGGTGINLFHRDMPRLSVDIDLIWLPIEERAEALRNIDAALQQIRVDLEAELPGARVQVAQSEDEKRLVLQRGGAQIKIETASVMRGVVHPVELKRLVPRAEEQFGFVEMRMVSFPDLYGGKLVAALDRQHPRDLFDVRQLLAVEGIDDELFRTFLVYLASSSRPPHELLNPNLKDISGVFESQFEGMSFVPVGLDELLAARDTL